MTTQQYGNSQTLKVFENDLIKIQKSQKAILCDLSTDLKNLISAIEGTNSSNTYNTNEQFVVSDTNTLTLPANTYHTVSYVVLSGTANITQSGTLLSSAPQGYSGVASATTLLEGNFVFTGLSAGSKIIITTIK